ncbi:MAG: hypothetical protein LBR88_03185 [Zoogloeaceae bacterium]|jgi:hypothetical protein|nr:hypothetical protein [Zoogloeaceae bacterium]
MLSWFSPDAVPERMEICPASARARALLLGLVLGLPAGAGSMWLWRPMPSLAAASGASAEAGEVMALRTRVGELEEIVAQGDGALVNLQVSYSARQQLAEEVRNLTDRYATLDEDLSYALRLVPVGGAQGTLRLERLNVHADPLSAHSFRFSVLVGYESGRQPQEFSGTLKFILTVLRNGKLHELTWPEQDRMPEAEYQQGYLVKTRQWTRKTGTLEVAPGDVLKKVEARLTQNGSLRATAVASL